MSPTRFLTATREFFWQGRALEAAARDGFWQGRPGWDEFVLGRAALRSADRLRAAGDRASPALLLYGAAARLFIDARWLSQGETTTSESHAERWRRLTAPPLLRTAPPGESERALRWLALAGESELSRLSREQAREAAGHLRSFARGCYRDLLRRARPARRVLMRRWIRTGPVLVMLACALLSPVRRLSPRNLALNQGVYVPGAMPEYDVRKLVDGNRNNIGFHTGGDAKRVTIDLGAKRRITRVVVYNRTDCCQERAIPLELELEVGGRYRSFGERKTHFDRWQVPIPGVITHKVRLVSKNTEPFHLAEIEIY